MQCVLCDWEVAGAVVVIGGFIARAFTARLLAPRLLVCPGNLHTVSETQVFFIKHGICYMNFVIFVCLSSRQARKLRQMAKRVIKLFHRLLFSFSHNTCGYKTVTLLYCY